MRRRGGRGENRVSFQRHEIEAASTRVEAVHQGLRASSFSHPQSRQIGFRATDERCNDFPTVAHSRTTGPAFGPAGESDGRSSSMATFR